MLGFVMHFAIDAEHLHPSTELALDCLHFLHEQATCRNILEIGCGNGLLSITCAQIWQANVLAVDIADAAIQDATGNIHTQQLQKQVTVLKSDRLKNPAISGRAPYDLIIANMLDQWLVEMALDIKKHARSSGYVVLSGMLAWLAADTKQSYTNLGFEILKEFNHDQWHSCVLKAPAV